MSCWRNSNFKPDYLTEDVAGWAGGAQVTWNWFDGQLTKGKVQETRALLQKAGLEIDNPTLTAA